MSLVALFLLAISALSAVAGRWTRLHPLAIALLAGVPGGLVGFLIAGLTLSPAALPVGAIAFVITAVAGALGAFLGWLRRTHLQKDI